LNRYHLILKLPKASSTRKVKRIPCAFCKKKIRIGQNKFHYDEGFTTSKSMQKQGEFWDMHIGCYNIMLKLSIVKLQQELKEVFN